jgi:hypothetical protein
MLPEREWPGRTVLDVSVETSDSGLGMYSSVSENPTLFRTAGLGVCSSSGTGGDGSSSRSAASSGAETGVAFPISTGFSGTGRFWPRGRSAAAGLAGVLLPLILGLDAGTIIEDRSWLEMAADRR